MFKLYSYHRIFCNVGFREKMKNHSNTDIGLFTLPLGRASILPLSNFVKILNAISNKFILITGNEGYILFRNERSFPVYGINYKIDNSLWKIVRFLYGQIKGSIYLIKNVNNVRYWFFFGGQRSIIPILTAKLLNKKIVIVMAGSAILDSFFSKDNTLIYTKILSLSCLSLADKLVIYSPNLIQEWDLEAYNDKILIAHRHFLDFNNFYISIPLLNRPNIIGYIGRFSAEKGIQHFIQALPAILNEQKDLHVLIGGDGQIIEVIKAFLKQRKIDPRVDLPGWISHNDLPKYLNQLRLLVLPSYTEGLPNIMLEAMACGTPVLATPVGAIPDVIQDGETGFIMEENSPECIARNVMRALSSPDLEGIAERGRRYVEGEFTFEKAVERWRGILDRI